MRESLRFNVILTPPCQIDGEFEWRYALEGEVLCRDHRFRPAPDARLC